MTTAEAILEFKLSIDKIDTDAYPDIRKEEVLFFLNEAQERFVKVRYNKNNILVPRREDID